MTDTNALLSIGFALIAKFTNIVEVPPQAVPATTNDLARYVVGSPTSPIFLHLVHRRGTSFSIDGGIVYRYECPGSYFQLQDPDLIPKYLGTPTLTSNQVIELATSTVRRFARDRDPLAGATRSVRIDKTRDGTLVPFYEVRWTRGEEPQEEVAWIEVDARSGKVVFLHLWDGAFYDRAVEQATRNRVYVAEARRKAPPVRRDLCPLPSTNQVLDGIGKWLGFCQLLGLDPGNQTNLADVDWDRTMLYTNSNLSAKSPLCHVFFKNNGGFLSQDGATLEWASADAAFREGWSVRPAAEWTPFQGKIVKQWKDLAKDLERDLVKKLGIPRSMLAGLGVTPMTRPAPFGSEGVTRQVLRWDRWPRGRGFVPIADVQQAFMAEFDLQTGQLKSIAFRGPEFVRRVVRAQNKGK